MLSKLKIPFLKVTTVFGKTKKIKVIKMFLDDKMRDELIVIIMYRSSKRKQYFDYSNYII
jgi:vacuolar-type H+-ATPase subunit D/Vma8